ncbi:hypothetical protein L2E82_35477 [Cichorium intybus]|uniref:Uncharacterized protein n=1 Tax=Cichorium intybus TaxID=13427 RepID=A0ACB9BNY9_CICIN|nr:hypothetical protein L2E82_35477 [Cichorium intybus]
MESDQSLTASIKSSNIIKLLVALEKPDSEHLQADSYPSHMHPENQHSSSDLTLQRVEEKLDQILSKMNELAPPPPTFVTSTLLQTASDAAVTKMNDQKSFRLEKYSELCAELSTELSNIFQEVDALLKEVKTSFEAVVKILATHHAKELKRYDAMLEFSNSHIRAYQFISLALG